MKTCTRCQQEKQESEFAFRNKQKGTLQPICRACKKELDKKDYEREDRRLSIRAAQKKQSIKSKKRFEEYKKTLCCSKCNESRYYVLEFHHINGDKLYNIGNMSRSGIRFETLKKEMDKCIVLCANCHRELHYLERNVSPLPDKQ